MSDEAHHSGSHETIHDIPHGQPDIDKLVAPETLILGFLCFILLIGTLFRRLNQKYGVHI